MIGGRSGMGHEKNYPKAPTLNFEFFDCPGCVHETRPGQAEQRGGVVKSDLSEKSILSIIRAQQIPSYHLI